MRFCWSVKKHASDLRDLCTVKEESYFRQEKCMKTKPEHSNPHGKAKVYFTAHVFCSLKPMLFT